MIANIEPQLVGMARIADPVELRKAVDRMVDAFDGDGGAASDADEFAKNHLTFEATYDGRFEPHGTVDAESGEIIAAALEAEMATLRHNNDTRTGPKLRAEAFTSICRWYLAHHDNGRPRRRGQNHLGIITDLSELAGTNTQLIAEVRAEAAHGSRLSRSTTRTAVVLAASSMPLITDGPSQLLDVGRDTRVVSIAMWARNVCDKRTLMGRMHPTTGILRSAPHRLLDQRRTHQPEQPQTPLLAPPPPNTRPRPNPTPVARIGRQRTRVFHM